MYRGTLDDVMTDLADGMKRRKIWKSAINAKGSKLDKKRAELVNNTYQDTAVVLALQTPRIIRAVLDYKIDNPDAEGVEQLLRESIGLALDIYRGSLHVKDIAHLREALMSSGNGELLMMPLEQLGDEISWGATHPEKCCAISAEKLASAHDVYEKRDFMFIALAHGGVAAGMDVFLRYCYLSQSTGSSFYAVRFSADKKEDQQPQLTAGETDYLRTLSEGKRIVIFDEDTYSGRTLNNAVDFFSNQIFPGSNITPLTNIKLQWTAKPAPSQILQFLEGT